MHAEYIGKDEDGQDIMLLIVPHATDSRRSYLCTAGAQSWYQHSPCRGIGEKGVAVRQSQVPREQACREIARPAALLRGGSQRDERAGPYARAMGRDPCR